MKVRYFAVALVLAGCGGKKGTIELDLVMPVGSNPLAAGSKIEIIAGPHSGSAPITTTNGQSSYNLSFDESPPKSAYNLVMQVLDNSGNIGAYGETPLITLNAVNQGPFGVWLSVPGTIGASPSKLDQDAGAGATMMAGCNVTGLGGVLAGGDTPTSNGALAPVTTSYVYDVFTSAIIDTAALTTARAGAVCVPSTGKGIVYGGTSSGTAPFVGVGTAEAFDPTSGGSGQWVNIAAGTTMPTPASFSSVAQLSDGTGLVTGGYDQTGAMTNAVTLITTGSTIALNGSTTKMNASRAHHVSAPITIGQNADAAIIIGGTITTDSANPPPIAETYANGAFSTLALTGVPNLWYATATAVNGSVFVAGGTVGANGTATDTAFLVSYTNGALSAAPFTLPKARARHTATLVGNDILLCGGVDQTGAVLSTCDVISTSPSINAVAQIGGLDARQNHVAIALETGPVIFVGGDDGTQGTTGKPIHQIDVYTPTMAEEAVVNMTNHAVIGAATADGGT